MNKLFFGLLILFMMMFPSSFAKEAVNDEIMNKLLENVETVLPETNTDYNYEDFEKIPIQLVISKKISTKKDDVFDNEELLFYVKNPVKYKNRIIIEKGEEVKANVALYMTKGMNGVPACIVVENFKIDGIESKKLSGMYIKRGLNLTSMVMPLKWSLTPIPGVGSLTNFILGGHATIDKSDIVTIYYYPNRNSSI